ncbi:Na+/H+ antiporter subunit E [Arenimonas composti]|uniref:Cation:proton antiporter n=1 Tax=Arenimonas composti TR7-09 = DSM 18010 TaxID=1121013 RepID=A0A091BDZ3_9GAMM|nr:Na+/H+ antiporter subunit E [Arenimonas composti]KFN49926.1 hypothetical protein P873_08770 [Arenimonas composti TR7-09 = DSM 18010]
MSVLRRLVPAPALSLVLFALWLLLARGAAPADLLVAAIVALAVPPLTTRLRLVHAPLKRPATALRFAMRVMVDVVASNIEVGLDVVFFRTRKPDSHFVVVPLELRDPAGLAMLALVTTIVPGTVWSELAVDRSSLLLHVWNVGDEAAFVARYKQRYESPLREIFE